MTEQPLLSIQVPIYNAEKYIPKLIDCLSNQTYKNIEVVLVEDFSTDNSYQLLKDYAEKDSRFKVIKRDTKGGTAATGIEYSLPYCNGKYFFYMSQDDFIDYDLIEKCVKKAEENDADIVLVNTQLYKEGEPLNFAQKYPIDKNYDSIISGEDAFYESLTWNIGAFALRRRDVIEKCPTIANYYNDCECSYRKQYLFAKKIMFCDTNFYYRQDNNDAITKKINYFTFDILTTDILLLKILIERKYSRKKILKRLKQIIRGFGSWKRTFIQKYDNFNEEQKTYIKNTLINARKDLYSIIKEQKYIAGYILMLSSDIRIKIKG